MICFEAQGFEEFSGIKNYLELTIMNVCKTLAVFARFDSYYVN